MRSAGHDGLSEKRALAALRPGAFLLRLVTCVACPRVRSRRRILRVLRRRGGVWVFVLCLPTEERRRRPRGLARERRLDVHGEEAVRYARREELLRGHSETPRELADSDGGPDPDDGND